MEDFVAAQLQTRPSHTICPSCYATRVKPEMELLGIKVDESKIQ